MKPRAERLIKTHINPYEAQTPKITPIDPGKLIKLQPKAPPLKGEEEASKKLL